MSAETKKSMAVIGLGPAGCIFLASLPPEYLTPSLVVFDSGCIGGDLARHYGCVMANITCREIENALRIVPAWKNSDMTAITSKYAPDSCPLLSDACKMISHLTTPILSKVTLQNVHVKEIHKSGDCWELSTEAGEKQIFKKVILCTGAVPKLMNVPKLHIPLDIALCEGFLRSFVEPTSRIILFGTAHSGTLILRNLKNVGCHNVTAIYRGKTPFRFARDGDTEGIKQESAHIADEILSGAWGTMTPTLVNADDIQNVIRKSIECDYVIYAIGFQPKFPTIYLEDSIKINAGDNYDNKTGKVIEGIWGFGIGFPSTYVTPQGTVAPDVGFGPFAAHINACMPEIISQ
jgi:pyruvate/2-oxoglutarate dehydrogenase complex dihydrolipoamide dehydrogenase (E3) component